MSEAVLDRRYAGIAAAGTELALVQKSALKKAAWRLVPILTIAYIFNYLDRTAISFAGLQMNQELGLTATQFGLAGSMFFYSYTLCEVPSNLALYKFGARLWIARIMISWGIISTGMAFVYDANSLYAMRLLLGIAEAGFFPGIAYFLSAWFPREYRSRMLAWFLIGIPGSSLIGGPLCTMLLQLDGLFGIAGWKWLFIMVSLPCVVLGLLVLKLLSDRPEEASWLTREEKDAITGMLAAETLDRPKSSLLGAITDIRIIILALVQFGFTLGSYGLGIWMPLILKEYQLSDLAIGFLTVIPYLFAIIGMLLWAWYADKTGQKIVNLALACLLGTIGFAAYVVSGSLLISLFDLTLALIGVTAARGIFWSIPPRLLTGIGAAAGIAFINMIGTSGGGVGPVMMGALKDATGGFEYGILTMAAIMLITALLAISLKLAVRHE